MKLRLLRRQTSIELTPQEFIEVELWRRDRNAPDLRVSTYRVEDDGETTRVMAEHAASFLSPPWRMDALQVEKSWQGVECPATPGATRFEFANSRHHEYQFADSAELLRHVERLLLTTPSPLVGRSRPELLAYVSARIVEEDLEWTEALQRAPHGATWARSASAG